jgi:Trk K+ transport system NAD-binding subunit
MKTKYSDHYVIINWNTKGSTVLEQLRNDDFGKNKKEVVVILSIPRDDGDKFSSDDGVAYIHGGISDESLMSAGVEDAHSVIILANEAVEAEVADAETILAILAIRQMRRKDGNQVPIVAEIRNPEKVKLANYVGVLENGSVEVVSADQLGAKLLCQAAVSPGLTHIYADLLTFSKESSEIYALEITPELAKRSFSDICRCASEGRGPKTAVIPMGIKRGNVTHLNPGDDEIGSLQAGDSLIAICDNVEGLERMMKDAAGDV